MKNYLQELEEKINEVVLYHDKNRHKLKPKPLKGDTTVYPIIPPLTTLNDLCEVFLLQPNFNVYVTNEGNRKYYACLKATKGFNLRGTK